MTDEQFNHIIVVGTNCVAEAVQTVGEHSVHGDHGRLVQRLSIPSLTSAPQCQHIADLVLAYWMTPDVSGAVFDRELDDVIARMVAA